MFVCLDTSAGGIALVEGPENLVEFMNCMYSFLLFLKSGFGPCGALMVFVCACNGVGAGTRDNGRSLSTTASPSLANVSAITPQLGSKTSEVVGLGSVGSMK
jgi:hypothetical protein